MKERIAWIGGNHRRHLYYINNIAENLGLVGGIVQERESMMPMPPMDTRVYDLKNWARHFGARDIAEEIYFGEQKEPDIDLLRVDEATLNELESAEFMRKLKPDIVLIFGSGMIREPLLSALPKDTINLHLGISPRYRGAATLFWPFYFLEPNWAGTTFHYIQHSPDSGDIIHQVVPIMERGDGIHNIACKAVVESTLEAIALLNRYPKWDRFKQKPEAGKNFLASDFRPQHLRVIYSEFDNKMVDAYLSGELKPREPVLKRQF